MLDDGRFIFFGTTNVIGSNSKKEASALITSVGTTKGQGIIIVIVVVVATFFLTFSFFEDFKSK